NTGTENPRCCKDSRPQLGYSGSEGTRPMISIAQITDLHITSDSNAETKTRNEARLRETLKAIHTLKPRPVAIVASGDLVDRGDPKEYAELNAILQGNDIPIHLGIGNQRSACQLPRGIPWDAGGREWIRSIHVGLQQRSPRH